MHSLDDKDIRHTGGPAVMQVRYSLCWDCHLQADVSKLFQMQKRCMLFVTEH